MWINISAENNACQLFALKPTNRSNTILVIFFSHTSLNDHTFHLRTKNPKQQNKCTQLNHFVQETEYLPWACQGRHVKVCSGGGPGLCKECFCFLTVNETDFIQTPALCKGMIFCNETILHIHSKNKWSVNQRKPSRAALTVLF